MAKMKIYEISRSLQGAFPDLKSKDLIKLLQENGFQVKSAQSSIEDDAIKFLLNKFQNKKAEPAKVAEEPVKAEPVDRRENRAEGKACGGSTGEGKDSRERDRKEGSEAGNCFKRTERRKEGRSEEGGAKERRKSSCGAEGTGEKACFRKSSIPG